MPGLSSGSEQSGDLPFVIPFGDSYPQVTSEERVIVAEQFKTFVEDNLIQYLGELTFPDLLALEPYSATELYLRRRATETDWTIWMASGLEYQSHPRNSTGTNQPFSFLAIKHTDIRHQYIVDAGSDGDVTRTDSPIEGTTSTIEDEKRDAFEDFKEQFRSKGYSEDELDEVLGNLTMREERLVLRECRRRKREFDTKLGINHQPISKQEMDGMQAYFTEKTFEAFDPPE